MRTTFGEMVLEVANDRRNVNDINTVANTAPRKAGSHVSVTSPQATSMLEGAELSAGLACLRASFLPGRSGGGAKKETPSNS